MLACDVMLGHSKSTYAPPTVHDKSCFSPTKDLERPLLPRLFGALSFDSVTAQGGVGVPGMEMVVYDPAQAVPRYVMLVEESSQSGSPDLL